MKSCKTSSRKTGLRSRLSLTLLVGWWVAVLSVLGVAAPGYGGDRTSVQVDSSAFPAEPEKFYFRKLENIPFGVGEEFQYTVRYGVIKAGSASMRVEELTERQGRPCLHVVSEVKTSRFFSAFFKVRDRVESWIDAEGIYPWEFRKKLREGGYRAALHAVYDHRRGLAYVDGDTVKIPPFVQDVLSVFYFIRTQPLRLGGSVDFYSHDNKKVFPLEARVVREERVKTGAGTFDTYLVIPQMRKTRDGAGLFRPKGEMWIWFSKDPSHIPVLIKSKLNFGSLTLELKKIRRSERLVER